MATGAMLYRWDGVAESISLSVNVAISFFDCLQYKKWSVSLKNSTFHTASYKNSWITQDQRLQTRLKKYVQMNIMI